MNFKSILIISYGRSGSTLLQGLLNSIENCRITGENDNTFYHLYSSLKSIKRTVKIGKEVPEHPWYRHETFSEENALAHFRRMVRGLLIDEFDDKICFGFKEIRYTPQDILDEDFQTYIEFLNQVFPNPLFLFNTRNIADTAKSGWWKKGDRDKVELLLKKSNERFMVFCSKHANAFHISYEDVINKTDRLKEMYRLLGAKYDEQVIDKVLNTPHSVKIRI